MNNEVITKTKVDKEMQAINFLLTNHENDMRKKMNESIDRKTSNHRREKWMRVRVKILKIQMKIGNEYEMTQISEINQSLKGIKVKILIEMKIVLLRIMKNQIEGRMIETIECKDIKVKMMTLKTLIQFITKMNE